MQIRRRTLRSLAAALAPLALAGCAALLGPQPTGVVATVPEVAVARAPFAAVQVSWKERLAQPYVFLELRGDYADAGSFLPRLFDEVAAQGLRVTGPPFALFYDDPSVVPLPERRSRVGVPVAGATSVAAPLGYARLPAANVAYAHVGGPYSNVQAAYPAVFDRMRERQWVLDGPIREVYLVNPADVQSRDQLVTEVQLPWRPLF